MVFVSGQPLPPDLLTTSPEVMGGVVVFAGTRVPFQALLDYLEGGQTLDEFIDDFPSVTREHAVAVLESAKESLVARAHPVG